ncbi:hypothetical protein OESDEN_01696 [Oesophagostomum dentatum]|uniref:Methyltransferase FkbM domain-containing protein n=1 Tax=Oesophagostomum dentatum TaxID=61180 RepID=A0A0B1TM34_OESDE|nr:hypothetical protein OESDEN_01696 [Oesophagostomum dentatum]
MQRTHYTYIALVTFMCIMIVFCVVIWPKSSPLVKTGESMLQSIKLYKDDIPMKIKDAYDAWHECISGKLVPNFDKPDKVWQTFGDTVNGCYKQTPLKRINLTGVHNKDEFKYHIFNNTDHSPSVVVTLGVGWDVQAERKLKELLPNGSLFYGADPIYEENDKLFSSVGVFFPIAVGNETKLSQAYVMPKELKGNYEFQTMVHIDIITFLTKLTKTPFVDQLLMDNEGPEYDIIPMMGIGAEFDQNNIVVCQINAEIHHIYNDFKERLIRLMRKILDDRRYAVMQVGFTGHQRTFLLNLGNQRCVEKYIAQFF